MPGWALFDVSRYATNRYLRYSRPPGIALACVSLVANDGSLRAMEDTAMTNDSAAFAAILGGLVVLCWILVHSASGLYAAASAQAEPGCLFASDCVRVLTDAL